MTDIRPNMVECSTRQLWSVEDHCDPSDPSSIIASSSLDHHHWLQAWSDLPASPHVSSKMAAVNALIHTDNHSTTTTTPSSSPAAVSAANSDVTADTMTSSSSATVIGHGRGRPTNGRSLMSVFGSEPTNNHSTTAAVLMKHSPSEGATDTHVLGSRLHALTISNGVSRSVANHTAVNRSAAKLPGNTEVRAQRRPLHLSNRLSPALTPPIIVPPPHRHLPPATSLQQEMAELDRQRLLNNGMHVLSHHAYLASLATQQQHSQLQAGVVGSAVATGFQGLPYMATAPSTAQEQYFIAGMYPGAATAAMYPAGTPAFYGLPYMFPSATTAGLMVSSCHQPQHLSQSSSVASPADSPCSLLSADSSHCPVPPPPPTTNPHLPLVSFSAAFGDATANSELAAAAVNGCAGVSASSCSSSSTCSSMLSAAELAAVSSSGVCAPSYPPACLLPPPAALLTAPPPPPSCLARRAVGSDRRAAAGRLGSVLLDSLRGLHDSGDDGQLQLAQLVGHLRPLAQDQHGSRFIQQRLQQATAAEKQLVFGELLAAVPSLITDVFGNYVVQKLLEFGSPEQRTVLAQLLVGRVVSLSTHMYGCRVVQKALEMTGDEQRTALACELRGHVTRCVRDQNGNHVVQKCIECVCDSSVRQFVVDAFVGHARQLAAHPYGCRVIQRLLEHCERQQTRPLLDELHVSCGALLADQYGNYVIQHVVQHGPAADRTRVINQLLSGQLAALCQHKFASNVVEKAVIHGECQQRAALVDQLCVLTDSVMLAVLKDQFGNYVVQKMLDTAESPQRCRLIAHVQPHVASLKRYTFGKHILAKLEKCSTGERVVSAVNPLSASVSTAAGDPVD